MQRTVDEETPLLAESTTKQSTPLPWPQFSILLVLQLAEPLTSNVISPFTPQLVRDLGVTQGVESRVGYYVGLLQSLFFVAEACTVLYWSRTSDQIGRKPVIMSGLLGLSLSMYCFGLSKTFWGLVLSRSMSGALNGNIGVMKSMVVEITDSTNISKAYAFMPLAWNTGGTLGPMIGGWLVQPVKRFPKVFGGNLFLQEYPYFLPCAVSATFSLIAFVVTFFFLNETLPCPIPMRRYFGISTLQPTVDKWSTSASSNKIAHSGNKQSKFESQLPIRSLFTPRVIIAAGNYASVSLVDISFRTIQPIFFSTPRHLGGLGLPPSTIGIILACFGLLNGSAQVLFFARVSNRWGPRNVFLWGLVLAIPALATFPCISYLSRTQGYTTILWVIVGLQIVLSIGLCFCFGAVFIFIASASPNRASIGATNGISQMMVSVVRAIGPAAASSLFSLSLDKHYLGGFLVYYVLIALVGIALYIGSMLPRQVWTD